MICDRALMPGVAERGRVVKDLSVRPSGRLKGTRQHPLACDLREVHVTIETGKTLRIVSNPLTSPDEVIADHYKTRLGAAKPTPDRFIATHTGPATVMPGLVAHGLVPWVPRTHRASNSEAQ